MLFRSDASTVQPPPPEEPPQPAPALVDAAPADPAQAEPQAAAAAAAALAPQEFAQDLPRGLVEVINPVSGDGAPTVREAVTGTTWLGPDPRAYLALSRDGRKTRVPIDWVGPEETEMFEP
eukprot:1157743-Alexandrium_andersonii.AAC.1